MDEYSKTQSLLQAALDERLTRRAVLRRGLAMGVSLPGIVAVLAACGRAAPEITRWQPQQSGSLSGQAQEVATAVPTAVAMSELRVALIGDYGMAGEPVAAVAALVASWQPDLVVTLGDNNYPDGTSETIDANIGQYYQQYIAPYRGQYGPGASENRFFPVLGNHDWVVGYPEPYLSYFTLPGNGRYYDFVRGPLHFFMLDSMPGEPDGVSADSIQGQWLQGALAASQALWKLVVMHHPPFSSGHHGSSDWMQWPFAAWGASMVLAGHDHSYERLNIDGISYLVNGLGGAARYAPGCCPLPGSLAFFNEDHGAMLLEATETSLRLQFVTRAAVVVDELSM